MKRLSIYICGVALLLFCGCHGNNRAYTGRLQSYLDQKDYFRLENALIRFKNQIGNQQRLYFQAFVDNAFNRNESAVLDIDTLLKMYVSGMTDTVKASLGILETDCYFKLFQYAKAAQSTRNTLKFYSGVLEKEKVADIKNGLLKDEGLQNVPPQVTEISDDVTIAWEKDKIGIIEIPVKLHDKTYNCIFDTRANISSISETYASKLGLRILPATYEEGSGITGIKFRTGLGIADSLYIGEILVRNAVFQVMPDSILYIGPIQFSLNVIIGFPIIEQLREINIYSNGKMNIPLYPAKKELHNLAIDGLDPVIFLGTGRDSLCFHLDLGADNSILYSNYFDKYKGIILKEAHQKTAQYGGAGGIQKKQVYTLNNFPVYLENEKVVLDSVDIFTQPIFPGEKYYGNIGRDFMYQFKEFTMNFKYMYVEGKK